MWHAHVVPFTHYSASFFLFLQRSAGASALETSTFTKILLSVGG